MLHSPNSDPLTTLHGSPTLAPLYQLYRHVTANDAAASGGYLGTGVKKAHGCNCATYGEVEFQAVQRSSAGVTGNVGGAGALTMALYEWVPGAGDGGVNSGRFMATGDTVTAGGAGQPIRLAVAGRGRILFAHITGLAGSESASVYASGRDIGDAV